MTLNADYIAWKLLKMALEVEYMMDFYHPGLPVTDHFWPSICLFICEQDNSKTDRWILIKLEKSKMVKGRYD